MNRGSSLLIGLVLLCACEEKKQAETVDECPVRCVQDPAPHRIVTKGCLHSGECPSGTRCLPAASTETVLGACGENGGECPPDTGLGMDLDCSGCSRSEEMELECEHRSLECLLPTPGSSHRTALTNGFNVERFRLDESPDGETAVFTWNQPGDAEFVVCALFGCVPEFVTRDGRIEIVNFDQCVLARHVFTEEDAAFNLGNEQWAHDEKDWEPGPESCDAAGPVDAWDGFPRITHLLVGCWAYDTTSLIGATNLVPVEPSETHAYRNVFVNEHTECAEPENEGKSCYFDEEGTEAFFGTCYRGLCRNRCLVDTDCIPPGEDEAVVDGGMDAGPVVDAGAQDGWRCDRKPVESSPKKYVGVCVRDNQDGGP